MEWLEYRIKQLENQLKDPEIVDKNRVEIKLETYREILITFKNMDYYIKKNG